MGLFSWFGGQKSANDAQPINGGDAWQMIHEPMTGAWQRNQEMTVSRDDQMTHHAVFACVSLISRDVGKLKLRTKKEEDGVKLNCKSKANKLLANPNQYQTMQQFFEAWTTSKLTKGNTYVWKVRNIYNEIWRLHVLDADRVKPLIATNGEVFYQVKKGRLFNIQEDVILPASEIIHDRFNCFYHPLVGLSPIVACALSASQGINIQRDANKFFSNASRPSGILSAPGAISDETAADLKKNWRKNYTGGNTGETAVLGDGMEYQPISMSAHDAQLVEQLKLSGEVVCTSFTMPAFKVGLGTAPSSNPNDIYYSDCLQHYLESIENLLNTDLELEDGVETEFDIKALIRMDANSQMSYLKDGIGAAIMSPNEARAELGYKAVAGGDSPMIQQQNYSLSAIDKRDSSENPFAKAPNVPTPSEDTVNE